MRDSCQPGQCCANYVIANTGGFLSSPCGCIGTGGDAYNAIMADTVGAIYRATAPIFNGGIGVVDRWTKAQLVSEETQALIKAGANPAEAATQAQVDVENTIATAPSLKKCACKTPNILLWIAVIVGGAILLMIFGNAAAKKVVGA